MKEFALLLALLLCAGLAPAASPAAGPATQPAQPRVVVQPADTGAELANPGMGWVLHYYDNVPAHYGSRLKASDTLDDFPGLTVIYLRIPWSYIEPKEGDFRWEVLDTPAQRWIAHGKQIALRLTVSESWMRYATPQWVQAAGAKGYDFRPGKGVVKGGPFWEPDHGDPVFLAKLENFLAALGKRYDGRREVAFVDVGSVGVWGEGHTGASTRKRYGFDVVKKHLDLHAKYFPRTLLAVNDDYVSQGGKEAIDYARKLGMTLRDDSILVQPGKRAYFHADFARAFWPARPVILESEHYGGSKQRGNWQDGRLYLQAVEDYHASYVSIHWWPREFLRAERPLIRQINARLGYRLQLARASWPATVRAGESFTFESTWRNAGVAPCLPGGYPIVSLTDADGGLAATWVDRRLNVRTLPVAPPGKAPARTSRATFHLLPLNLPCGVYDVCISVGDQRGRPTIALPLAHGDRDRHQNRRYKLGQIRITGDYSVRPGTLRRKADRYLLDLTWTAQRPIPAGATPFCHFDRHGKIAFQATPVGPPGRHSRTTTATVALTKTRRDVGRSEPSRGRPQSARRQADLSGPSVLPAAPNATATLKRAAFPINCPVTIPMEFNPPAGAAGTSYDVYVGLWLPQRIGRANERLLPTCGQADHRVRIGTLKLDAANTPTFHPADAEAGKSARASYGTPRMARTFSVRVRRMVW